MLKTIQRLEMAAQEQGEAAMQYSHGRSAVARQMIVTVRELMTVARDLREKDAQKNELIKVLADDLGRIRATRRHRWLFGRGK